MGFYISMPRSSLLIGGDVFVETGSAVFQTAKSMSNGQTLRKNRLSANLIGQITHLRDFQAR